MSPIFDTIVIGAGQAGLAAGYHLHRRGWHFAILEASSRPAGSWPSYYESLTLFSPARYASLPGLPLPGDPERYPTRDEVVAYLTEYATHFKLPLVLDTRVRAVEQQDGIFSIHGQSGQHYQARSVIAATGSFHRPHLPDLPGQASFGGQIIHAAAYRSPTPFQGQRVIVVGAGNSAVQIAWEMAQVAHTTLATRAPVRFTPQRILGRDLHFWLEVSGLDRARLGRWLGLHTAVGVLDTGRYRAALAAGRPGRAPMFTAFTPTGVVWPDGRHEAVDAVIFATGYRPNLDYLAPLGALDDAGNARQRAGISLVVPALGFVGLAGQRSIASATIRGVGADADHVIRHLDRVLHARAPAGVRKLACCTHPLSHS